MDRLEALPSAERSKEPPRFSASFGPSDLGREHSLSQAHAGKHASGPASQSPVGSSVAPVGMASARGDMEHWLRAAARCVEEGNLRGANDAYATALRLSPLDKELLDAALALQAERLAEAETRLRRRLHRLPGDVAALRMLAELGSRLGRYEDAARLLGRCLELYPGFLDARGQLARIYLRQGRADRALELADRLLESQPSNHNWLLVRAGALAGLGRNENAISIYGDLLEQRPDQPLGWLNFGHALKTVGRQAEAVTAYRRALVLRPALGEAWWSLANLKTVRFGDDERAAMRAALTAQEIDKRDQIHLNFALGKAEEDSGQYEAAFKHYARANDLRRAQIGYSSERMHEEVQEAIETARQVLPSRAALRCEAHDPVFVIGMPRSGSTLIEQILASHDRVEGTAELPHIPALMRRLREENGHRSMAETLAGLTDARCRDLGEEYLALAAAQRRTGKPFFIDKLPNNWIHLAFIRLILPFAKVIDARRHPMACGWSMYRQHFARGQGFTYSLSDIGTYYKDYTRLMAVVDEVDPSAVIRVQYERLVTNSDNEIGNLLTRLGLEHDSKCWRFWENKRAVRTPSSEQVRQPIYATGLDDWRHFERCLTPLRVALGDAVQD